MECAGDILSSVIIVRLPFPLRSQSMEYKRSKCASTSEFNTGSDYHAYVQDLQLQYKAGILCGSLVRKASRQFRQYFY